MQDPLETVFVIRPSVADGDRYNDNPLVYGTTPTHSITGCLFDPGGSSEVRDGRTAVTTTPTLYLPPGADLAATDQVVVRGDLFEVAGKPAVWIDAGVVAQLQEVTG